MNDSFEQYRPLMFSIAYRMLGSAMEAEDIVQETYLRYLATPRDEIREPRAYLSTIVTRLCLDYLKSARVQRESYIGPWLPGADCDRRADRLGGVYGWRVRWRLPARPCPSANRIRCASQPSAGQRRIPSG